MIHSVAIVGLGGIGMLYDFKLPEAEYVQSHVRAFFLHPDFEIVGVVDIKAKLRDQFSGKYKVAAFSSVDELGLQCSPDVVVVASPTNTHRAVIEQVLQHCKPDLILCEKPLAYSTEHAQAIVQQCHEQGVQLFVNYIRRADPGVMEVKARLTSGQIASPFKAVVWYSKGLLHNGSHFLDLMTFWFGPVKAMAIINSGRDVGEQDGEPDFRVEFEMGEAIFCSSKEENFSHYTIEVVAQNGRLRYEQGGVIEWQAAGPHPTLDNYRQLQAEAETIANYMSHYQYLVADQLSLALRKSTHTLCTGDSGLMNIQTLVALLKYRI